jgi:ribosomal protein L7/L12
VAENEIHDESEWTVAELLEEYQDALDRENRLRQRLEAAGTFMGSLIKQMEIATDETYMPMTDAARDESRFAREALSMEARLWMEENGLVAVLDALNHGTGNCTVILTDPKDRKIPIIGVVRRFSSSGIKASKDLVDNAPSVLVEGVSRGFAESVKRSIEDAGGVAEITEEN